MDLVDDGPTPRGGVDGLAKTEEALIEGRSTEAAQVSTTPPPPHDGGGGEARDAVVKLRLRIGSFNVHRLIHPAALAQVVVDNGPFDLLALQESPATSSGFAGDKLAALCAKGGLLEGMAVAVERTADYGLNNVLLVRAGVPVLATAQWDLEAPASTERRTAVLATLSMGDGAPGGGRGGEAVTFVCTHLDAYTEANRLAQLTHLRSQLIDVGFNIAEQSFFLLGDMNALCSLDYTPEHWNQLKASRAIHGIKSSVTLTATLTAPIDAPVTIEPSWGLADMRAMAQKKRGVPVEGAVQTSQFGAHIDYVFGSAEATRRWEPVRFSHVAVDEHITDHALVVCDLISTRMTTSE